MPKNAPATATAQATTQAPPVKAIRDLVEWAIDIYGIEVTRFEPVKSVVAWLQEAEREGKGK